MHHLREKIVPEMDKLGMNHQILEATIRYDMLDRALADNNIINNEEIHVISRSEKADKILTHKWLGPFIFIFLQYLK